MKSNNNNKINNLKKSKDTIRSVDSNKHPIKNSNKHSSNNKRLSSFIQPAIIIVIVAIIFLFLTSMNRIAKEDKASELENLENLQNHYNELEKNSILENNKIVSDDSVISNQDSVTNLTNVSDSVKSYSNTISFYLNGVSASKKSEGYVVIDSIDFQIVNDFAFEKEYSLFFYLYDEDDDSLIRNKPVSTLKLPLMKPGQDLEMQESVHVGFNEIEKEKTLKFRIKDELDVILDDFFYTKSFENVPEDIESDDNDEVDGGKDLFEIIPLDFGYVKKNEDFVVMDNMSVKIKNGMNTPQDVTLFIYLYDENDESLIRNELRRKLIFEDIEPNSEITRFFPVHISFNELDLVKTIRFKAVSSSKLVLADVEYKKEFE